VAHGRVRATYDSFPRELLVRLPESTRTRRAFTRPASVDLAIGSTPVRRSVRFGSRGQAYVPENDTQPTFPLACRRLTLLSRPDCDARSPAPPIAPRPDRGPFPACAVAIVRLVRGSRLRLDRAVESRGCTQVGEDSCTTWCGSNACIVSISRRARASMLEPVHGSAYGCPASLSRGFWPCDPSAIPLADRSAPSPRNVHSRGAADELGRLPCFAGRPASPGFFISEERSEPSGTRGARPFGDPGPFDRRLQLTILFSRNACSSSRCTPCRVSPRGTGTLDSRRRAHFSELNRIPGALSSPIAPAVRTSDASSLRGLPGGARLRPPASARRSSCDDPRVVPESLGFLRHAA
jgi:hypothetical protein